MDVGQKTPPSKIAQPCSSPGWGGIVWPRVGTWNNRPGYLGTWELEGHLLSQAGLTEEPGCPLAGAGSEGHCLEH